MPALARLHADALAAGMALGATPETDLEEMHRSAVADERRLVLLAEVDGEAVGMAHVAPSGASNAPHRAEVQRVAVAAGARASGVGRQLMESVEEAALQRGLTLLWLTTHDGTDACAFYEALGYTKVGVMPEYSRRPDGSLAAAAFYAKVLRGSS
ncbi:MAG TPA: GNAT family N-acetyltransferase [Gaiellaceae bacterium]